MPNGLFRSNLLKYKTSIDAIKIPPTIVAIIEDIRMLDKSKYLIWISLFRAVSKIIDQS